VRQVGVELTRLVSRRAIVVVVLAVAAVAGLMAASAAYATRPPDNTERAAAEQIMERQQELDEDEYQDCLEDPQAYHFGFTSVEDCEELRPNLEWYLPRPPLALDDEVEDRGRLLLILLTGMGIVVGATFVGAAWASGSLSNQLLFEPRRLRLWSAKAVAVVLGTTGAAAVVLTGFWAALGAVAAARDVSVSAQTWAVVLGTAGRGLALVAAATLGAFALTMALRHTVATLGLLFGYAVVGEGLAASLPFDRMSQWSISNNVLAWLHDGTEVYDRSLCADVAGPCSATYVLPLSQSAIYLGVLLALAVVASLLTFTRRDVP
jgi:ABC-2 type transport system permease protein